jgi:hypothetical protein
LHIAAVPLQIRKQLQKETFYGCAICGCPVIEYVQIVPYNDTQTFIPENMVSLCPSHYLQYRNGENLSESSLRDAKKNPYNKTHEKDSFIIQSQDMSISIGKCKFVNTSRVLVIDDFDIICIKRENGKYLLLDINFFDKLNNLIAILSDNSWTAEKSSDWSVSYKSGSLTIRNQTKKISFEAKVETKPDNKESHITIKTDGMYYNGVPIEITETQVLIDKKEIAIDLKGTVLKNYETGISAETF